jgi:hypothetical protein
MADSPAAVEAYTIEGYDDTSRAGITVATVVGIGMLTLALGTVLYFGLRRPRQARGRSPYHPATTWATEAVPYYSGRG